MGVNRDRKIVGVVEWVTVKGVKGKKTVKAKLDTGAVRTSVDFKVASEVGLGPVVDTVRVRSAVATNSETRALVEAEIVIHQQSFRLPVSVDDRSKMKYAVLVGRDLMERSNFLIDPHQIAEPKA